MDFYMLLIKYPAIPAKGEIKGDITEQAEMSCKNVGAILKENGMYFTNVVKTTCFLTDISDFANSMKFILNIL